MQLALLLPTFILISIIVTYFILDKALIAYISKIESKTKTIQRISLLLIASEFVSLFSSSESKNLVEKLVKAEGENDELLFDSINASFGEAGTEIEKLYKEINKAYKPSEELSKIKMSTTYLKIFLLFYGICLSVSQYLIIYVFYPAHFDLFPPLSSDLLVATVLFSSIAVYISVYIHLISRRLEIRYSKLQSFQLAAY